MQILFITDLYPVKDNEIKTPKTLFNFVNNWEKSGNLVDVIKPNFILNSFLRKKPFYKTGSYEKVFNVNYWTPFCGNIKKKFSNLEKYDLVIAHMPSGILFADKLHVPFIAGVHNSDIEVLTKPPYKFYFGKRLKKALDNSRAIACRSDVLKNKLLELYPQYAEKTFVAPSGISPSIICNKTNFNNHEPLKVITCAKFIKRKNIDKIIEACKNLDGVELTVIGDGELRNKLKKFDKKVIFTGWLKPEEVYKKMCESDVFILPSQNETFGMVYLEAMASGCITICRQNDGIAGIIKDNENGFLTEADSKKIRELITHIKNMDKQDIIRIKTNSMITVEKYTDERCSENYINQILKFCND